MLLTDKEVLKQLKILNCSQVYEMIEEYPEDERDGRSDMQVLADEAGYLLSMYKEDGNVYYEDLLESRSILRKTKNGKVIPLNPRTLKPIYHNWDIEHCKDTVNEYRRLNSLMDRLNKKGIYSRW